MTQPAPKPLHEQTALVVGAGGLGCPVAVALAEAGVGRIVLVDPDTVERSNLQRQVLFATADLGRPKVEAAAEALARRFPRTAVAPRAERFTADNADALLAGVDVAVDATDDPDARFVLNDRALARSVPAVLGGVIRFEGLVLAVGPGHGPCFRCLFEGPPEPGEVATCSAAGVLGAMAGVVGHLQAERALGLLRGEVSRHTGFVTTVDGLRGRLRDVPLPEGTRCAACGGLHARVEVDAPAAAPVRDALAAAPPGALVEVRLPAGTPLPCPADAPAETVLAGPAADGALRWLLRAPARRGNTPSQPMRSRPPAGPPTERQAMSVTIKIPTSLRKFAGGQDKVLVDGASVREALDQLEGAHPGILAKICDDNGNLRRFINVYADQEDIRFLDNLDTALGDGAELQIVPAIAGGR